MKLQEVVLPKQVSQIWKAVPTMDIKNKDKNKDLDLLFFIKFRFFSWQFLLFAVNSQFTSRTSVFFLPQNKKMKKIFAIFSHSSDFSQN